MTHKSANDSANDVNPNPATCRDWSGNQYKYPLRTRTTLLGLGYAIWEMADICEWLDMVHQPSYSPTSPPFGEDHFTAIPLDQITPFGVDTAGNTYFDMPIDPALHIT